MITKTKQEIEERLKEIQEQYKGQPISFFIEVNDDHTEIILQTKSFDTIEECLNLWNNTITFQDKDTEVWLNYEIEDSDIDRFADIVLGKDGNYGLNW